MEIRFCLTHWYILKKLRFYYTDISLLFSLIISNFGPVQFVKNCLKPAMGPGLNPLRFAYSFCVPCRFQTQTIHCVIHRDWNGRVCKEMKKKTSYSFNVVLFPFKFLIQFDFFSFLMPIIESEQSEECIGILQRFFLRLVPNNSTRTSAPIFTVIIWCHIWQPY